MLLFVGSVVAAAVSGAVGFGGALLLLPLLARVVGPASAVPLLTVAQLVGNLSRALLSARSIAWRAVAVFLVTAVPGAVAGSWCFVALPKETITRVIGTVLLLSIGLKTSGRMKIETTEPRLAGAGAVVGFLSGLVGSAGPLGAAASLSLDLPPIAYVATEATATVVMHATKMTAYSHFLSFDAAAWRLAVLLSLGMVVGSWIGKRTIEHLPVATFRKLVTGLLVVLALQMVILG